MPIIPALRRVLKAGGFLSSAAARVTQGNPVGGELSLLTSCTPEVLTLSLSFSADGSHVLPLWLLQRGL